MPDPRTPLPADLSPQARREYEALMDILMPEPPAQPPRTAAHVFDLSEYRRNRGNAS